MTVIDHVTISKVCNLFTPALTKSTASRKINLVRDALGKKKTDVLTMQEYCTYYGINYSNN